MRELEAVIGSVVAARRRRAGMSQESLAEAAGLHTTYISLIERGRRCPSTRVLIELANGLGIKASVLMANIERELERGTAAENETRPSRARQDGRKRG